MDEARQLRVLIANEKRERLELLAQVVQAETEFRRAADDELDAARRNYAAALERFNRFILANLTPGITAQRS